MAYDAYAPPDFTPAISASATERVAYLRRVAMLTTGGLMLTGIVAVVMAFVIAMAPGFFMSTPVQLAGILGSFLIAQYGGGALAFSQGATRYLGLAVGAVFEGIAFGFLVFTAAVLSMDVYGNPFGFMAQAFGVTGMVTIGMFVYLMSGPKDLSYVKGFLAVAFLPLMIGMVISFVFPSLFGGPLGIVVSAVFVITSAAGLLYQSNQVLHRYSTDMDVQGAFTMMMGLLVLYWNILVLLMKLRDR